jgi:hypothetical protein
LAFQPDFNIDGTDSELLGSNAQVLVVSRRPVWIRNTGVSSVHKTAECASARGPGKNTTRGLSARQLNFRRGVAYAWNQTKGEQPDEELGSGCA